MNALFIILFFLWFALRAFGAPNVARKAWPVETSDVRAYTLDLVYGETISLECKFTSYSEALDITNSTVTIHARTNGMPLAQSWQASGYATNGGLAVVRVNTSEWLPPGPTSFDYTLEVRSSTANTLRSFGQLRVRSSSVASTNAPLPVAYLSAYATTGALAAVQSSVVSNTTALSILKTNVVTWAETNGWETGSHAGLATTGDVAAALAAIPASDAYTVRDTTDTNRWWRFEGTQAVQYALGAAVTNYTVTLSTNFLETVGGTRPAWTNNVFPFTDGDWSGYTLENVYLVAGPNSSVWGIEGTSFPLYLVPGDYSQGTATVYQHVYYPTNATGNVIGPVPTNLVTDASLAAWWASIQDTKLDAQEFDEHVTPSITPDPHAGVYLLRAYTNAVPVAGNTMLTLDGTNLTVTGATYAYTATVTNAYKLSLPTNAPACFYGLTVYGTNACTLSDNLLLLGTRTVTGTNAIGFKPGTTAGTWEVLWGAK